MSRGRIVRNKVELERLSGRQQETRARALDAVAEARRKGVSLSAAAREAGTSLKSVRLYAATALQRLPSGRYRVRPSDKLYRRVRVISPDGPVWADTWSSKDAQLASAHANAIRRRGLDLDFGGLDALVGKKVAGVELETDVLALGAMAAAGDLDEFDLYSEGAS